MIWAPDGSGLYMTVRREGTGNIHFASVDGGVTPVTEGNHMLSVSSIGSGLAVGTLLRLSQPRRHRLLPSRRPRQHHTAHRRERRRARGREAGRGRGDLVQVGRGLRHPGMDHQAARFRRVEEVPAHPRHPRRTPRHVQRRASTSAGRTTPPMAMSSSTPTPAAHPAMAAPSATRSRTRIRGRISTT